MQASSVLSLSPSFNRCSNDKLAEIAARVVEEFRAESDADSDIFVDDDGACGCVDENRGICVNEKAEETEMERSAEEKVADKDENEEQQGNEDEDEDDDDDDDDFEFSFVQESEFSPISADEIFYNGQIRPIYPIFNRGLLLDNVEFMNCSSNLNRNSNSTSEEVSTPPASIRLPLRKLFMEEREANSSCSSSEADDLEGIPPGTYCVWRPKTPEMSPGGCKKSNSTGSSKRWKFRNLLHRSNSDGKDNFVFLTPSFKKKENKTEASKVTAKAKAKAVPVRENSPALHYAKSGGDKKKSYLPYRKDLVGFFANVNGVSRNLQPF